VQVICEIYIFYKHIVIVSYAVIISNGFCSDTSACIQVSGVGINEIDKLSNINIFPNPVTSSDNIQIELGTMLPEFNINVYDYLGRTLKKMFFKNESKVEFQLEGSTGIYTVEIISGSKHKYFKVIKQ